MENNRSRAPLGDKTNTSGQVDDKERKRERDRARWHAMSLEKKTAINKRRRESYHQRKQHVTGPTDCNESNILSSLCMFISHVCVFLIDV